ncbi:MAG: CHRD domain-containing protein [Bauldia sp.]
MRAGKTGAFWAVCSFTMVTAAGVAAQEMPTEQATADPLVAAAAATHFAELSAANVVQALAVEGVGTAWIAFDAATGTITWTVEFDGLTGPATAAAFHGPAEANATAEAVLGLAAEGAELTSPLEGTAALTAEQAEQLAVGQWYVSIATAANPDGEIRGQVIAAAAADAGDGAPDLAALMDAGQPLYDRNCAGCHGAQGQGGAGPTLAGMSSLANAAGLIGQIVYGGTFMPAFPNLSRSDIAAVGTYVRNAFGNSFGIVTEKDVAPMR